MRPGLVLGMLCFVYVLNFLDRQLISILAKPIQDGLQITDGQLGRITGFYFALFYCFIAIPVGWLADRTNRVKVLSIACALWSAATAACGMAGSYGQLVVARMAVGVGEAGGVPPSYAIISDYFPRERRGTAMAIFNLGPPLGSALGVAFGASLAAAFNWRMPFYVIGAIGVVTAVAVYILVSRAETRRTRCSDRARADSGGDRRLRLDHHAILLESDPAARVDRERRGELHHLRPQQLRHAVPHAREGHATERGRDLVRAGGGRGHERRHLCLRTAHRPVRRADEGGLRRHPGHLAGARVALLPGLRLGAALAAGAALPDAFRCS